MIVFISYATPDSDKFKIPYIAHQLEEYPDIYEALFWEEDTYNDLVDYMNDNIPISDIFILFCSENSLMSEVFRREWKTAIELEKRILPVFEDVNHIPPILRSSLGVSYDNTDIEDTIQKIYETIGKKLNRPMILESVLRPSQITPYINKIQDDLENKLNATSIARDLEMRILVYPLFPKETFVTRNEYDEMKRKLERNTSRGLYIDSISPAHIFNGLNVDQNGFYSISNHDLVGSIIIRKNGIIIYNLHFSKESSNKRELLQTYYMAAYLLGLLELLLFFYNEIKYDGEIKLIFDVINIQEWKYSPYPSYIPYDDREFSDAEFTPIEKSFHVRNLEDQDNKFKIVEDIFGEMILGYGVTRGFSIPSDLKNQY